MTRYDDRRRWPGTAPPTVGAPSRRDGSVRRTANVDLLRPEGLRGPLVIDGRGRDLATGAGRSSWVVDAAATQVVVDYIGGREIRSLVAVPGVDGLDALVGARAGSGFRRVLGEAMPDLVAGGSLVHLLLDEISPATLISGSVVAREGSIRLAAVGPSPHVPVGICAGWQSGGTMLEAIAETGVPLLGWGPRAPSLDAVDDAVAWHPMEPLSPSSMRRRRLIDLGPVAVGSEGADAGELAVEVRFRDSYWEQDGTETVVHEYGLTARVDPRTWRFTAASAAPGPLPAPECPSAAASAGRLVGLAVTELRDVVRDEFTGTTTCTHLNDVFRSLADLEHLWSAAAPVVGGATP